MKDCILSGFGTCGGKLSREHFISEVLLRHLFKGRKATIGGLRWQPPDTLQEVGISSLQSRILCESHNSGLSVLDSVAGVLFSTLDAVDKRPAQIPALVSLSGMHMERWFLKVVIGLVAGPGAGDGQVPDTWKSLVLGDPWPHGWGMYVSAPPGEQVFASSLYLVTKVNPASKRILAVQFVVAGVTFHLLLGRPDHPAAFGVFRPRGLIFHGPAGERRLEFQWPFQTNAALVFTNVGTTTDLPPYHSTWRR